MRGLRVAPVPQQSRRTKRSVCDPRNPRYNDASWLAVGEFINQKNNYASTTSSILVKNMNLPAKTERMYIDIAHLGDYLKLMRAHGFALVHYGGDALAAVAGTPTVGRTWHDALESCALAMAKDDAENATILVNVIKTTLFDLNKAGEAGIAVTKAICDTTCKV